jgi:preprotein translocase subunit SecY
MFFSFRPRERHGSQAMKRSLAVLSILFALVLVAGIVYAYSETLELPVGDSRTREVDLNAEDVVSGRLTIVGNAINFSVTDPDGKIILNYTVNNPLDFKFTAAKAGKYHFHFENWSSEEVKYATFNYNVQHYIFGFPQAFVILFVIVGVALIAVVIFVAMSPRP